MIRILTVVLALLASSVFAAEPNYFFSGDPPVQEPTKAAYLQKHKDGTFTITKPDGSVEKFGNRIIVTDDIPAEKLPEHVKHMTAEEFKTWAEQRNRVAYYKAKQQHDDYLVQRGPLTTMNLASSSASHNTRFGGGVGAGGYGGAGGYLGYQASNGIGGGVNYPYGYYGGVNGSSGGSGGFGSGFTFQGNNINTTDTASSQSWVKTFPDLNDGGGGPVILINPYCFDYWKQHTE
jgi:hypothetical protein